MTVTLRGFLLTTSALALTTAFPGMLLAQEQPEVHTDAVPKRGGKVTVHINEEQRTLNNALRASTGVSVVSSKIMESLVDLNSKGGPDPMLATSWKSSPDGKTITFNLRKGVQWHDGKPFTSADGRSEEHTSELQSIM